METNKQKCQYKPTRINQPDCNEQVVTSYGFCKKHSKTVQAKRAQEQYENEQLKIQSESNKILDEPPSSENPPPLRDERSEPQSELREKQAPSTAPKKLKPFTEGTAKPVIRKKIIRPNAWGRFEDPDTHILFNPIGKYAYGVQEKNGTTAPLTEKHIEICKRNGWDYVESVEESENNETESESENESEDEEELETASDSESEDESDDSEEPEELSAEANSDSE